MARMKKQPEYITIPHASSQGEKAPKAQALVSLVDIRKAGAERALVLDMGAAAEAVVFACQAAGVTPVVAYTADRAGAAHVALADAKVCIGASEEAFQDNYCLLAAAEIAHASAILTADSCLAKDVRFLHMAADLQRRLYCLDRGVFAASSFGGTTDAWACAAPRAQMLPRAGSEAWTVCSQCSKVLDASLLRARHKVCPACGHHFRMTSQERIRSLVDAESFQEWAEDIPQTDPLRFPGYLEKLEKTGARTGLTEAVRCGLARIAGMPLALCVMDSAFLMGSMGSVVGERITRAAERATAQRLPLVIFCASGGARMQEGLVSLMQMAKISAAIRRHQEAGLPYFSVITDPTTGGVTASFAMQGDIIMAEPRALVGFAGRRVIQDTIRQELPEEFQTAEFALEHGLIDAIVERPAMREALANLLAIFADRGPQEEGAGAPLQVGEALDDAGNLPKEDARAAQVPPASARHVASSSEGNQPSQAAQDAALSTCQDNPAWRSVKAARDTRRPTSAYYLENMVEGFFELHGDRAFADDAAVLAGVGWIGRRPAMLIAQEKGRNLQERIRRNFGCPQPEGYRKSLRLMRLAERFGLPVVCLVDTQGAFCGKEAEERGQGNAIADNLLALAGLRVPVVSVLVGEGGSGGALALALSDRVAMQEHAVYSVLSPEGFASILWKDRSRAPEAAAVMRMNAHDVHRMGIVDAVLEEGEGSAAESPQFASQAVRRYVADALNELCEVPVEHLLDQRYARFRKF